MRDELGLFWPSHIDYVCLIYGLSLVSMGAQCLALRARDRSLPWGLLAAFGVIHGIGEWLTMLTLSLPDTPMFRAARLLVLAASFVALIEFGRRGISRNSSSALRRWLTPALIGLSALGAIYTDPQGLDAACRYALGFPGALMAAAAIWKASRACENGKAYGLRVASLSMLVYGLAMGLIVPRAAFFPAAWLNHDTFLTAVGLPVQLVRALCVFVAMAGLWLRGMPSESTAERVGLLRRWSCPLALVMVLTLGWFAADSRGRSTDAETRSQLQGQAARIADTVNPERIRALSFTSADISNPVFQSLRQQIIAYNSFAPKSGAETQYSSIYSMVLRDGAIVFGPESIDENDPTASKPGTAYAKPPLALRRMFDSGHAFTYGPYTDEYGTFVSAFAPVIDPRTGKVLMVIGLDVMGNDWRARVAAARLLPITGTLVLALVLLGGMHAIRLRNALAAGGQPRLRYLEPALVAAVGLTVTAMLSFLTLESDNRERARVFKEIARTRADRVNDGFRAMRSDVTAVGRFFEASRDVERDEFHTYVGPAIESGAMQGCGWVQCVPAAERDEFGARARREGVGDPAIWQKDARGRSIPASARPRYYPVIFLEPCDSYGAVAGFDEGSEPARRAALARAARTGFPTAAEPVSVVNDPAGQQALLVFHPVYAESSAVGARRLRGFALGLTRYQALLNRTERGDAGAASMVETSLKDLMSAGSPRELAAAPEKASGDHPRVSGQFCQGERDIQDTSPIFAFGRAYGIVSHATPAFFAAHPARNHLETGASGLLITAILTALAVLVRNRQVILEREVRDRTADLRKTEEDLFTTLNSISDGFYSLDDNLVFTYFNSAAEAMLGRDRADVIGKAFFDVFPALKGSLYDANYTRALENRAHLDFESYRATSDRWYDVRVYPQPNGISVYFQDITERRNAAEALTAANDKLIRAQRVAHVGSWEDNLATGELHWSDEMYAIMGFAPGTAMTLTAATQVFAPGELERMQQAVSVAINGGAAYSMDYTIIRLDGSVRHIHDEGELVRDEHGEAVWMFGTTQDITERKQAEEALRESEVRWQFALSGAGDGVWDWRAKTNHVFYSPRWKAMIGYAVDEIGDSLEEWASRVHPDDKQRCHDALTAHIRGETPLYHNEHRLRCKDGSYKWVLDRGQVIERTDKGEAVRAIGTHTDITERKQAEEALRESEVNFRTFFASVTDMIIVARPDGQLLFTNTAITETLGYSAEELAAMCVLDLHPADRRLEAAELFAAMLRGERENCPLPLVTRDGVFVPVETRIWFGQWNGADCIFGISKNLTAEREAQQRFERLFRNNPALMALSTMPDRRFADVNDAFVNTLGYSLGEVLGRTGPELDLFPHVEQQIALAEKLQADGRVADTELQVRCKDGTLLHGLFSGEVISNNGQQYFLTVMIDITDRKLAEQELREAKDEIEAVNRQLVDALDQANRLAHQAEHAKQQIEEKAVELGHQATHDALTGLPNRKYFEQRLSERIASGTDRRSGSMAVLFLDLDRFKLINDTLGHKVGDLLLVEVARRLQSCLRSGDVLARMGGDEFTVILAGCQDQSETESITSRMIDSIGQQFEIQGHRFVIGVSIGLARFPQDAVDAVTLIKYADAAMYKAKELGRNNCQFFSDQISQENQARVEMERDLRLAVERDELKVYYQPIVDVKTMRIAGAEALLRWDHAAKGMISPGLFMPVAEETGLIVGVGKMVLDTACKQCESWHRAGHTDLDVSVNVSPIQLGGIEFASEVDSALSSAGLPPRYLKLEVIETILAKNDNDELDVLSILRALGISISIDDFGIGYSSLSRLNNLPINQLKVDGHFIRNIEHNAKDRAMAESIIVMAHNLGIRVTAEWVEDDEQMAIIESLGCDYAQGYLISPALSADEFDEFMRQWELKHRVADAA